MKACPPKFCTKSAFESQLQNFAQNSIWIHNSPNWYRNDRNRVNFSQNQTPLNLELRREINYHFSEGLSKLIIVRNYYWYFCHVSHPVAHFIIVFTCMERQRNYPCWHFNFVEFGVTMRSVDDVEFEGHK